jgi:tetratricopeptide (TPR) repeat protein
MPIYILAATLPLLLLPRPWGGDFGRELVFSALVLVSVMACLVRALAQGEARYARSPVLYAAAAMGIAATASTLLSHAPFVSLLFADAAAERLSWLVIGILLMAVSATALERREEAGTAVFILIFAGAAAAAAVAAQMLFGFSLWHAVGTADAAETNTIGTVNGLAIFFAALGMTAAGILLSAAASSWKAWVRWALAGACALFLLDIILVNFLWAWCAVLGASVLLFGLLLMEGASVNGGRTGRFSWRHWTAIGLVVVSLIMIMARGPVMARLNFPVEVSPSLSATISIAGSVFKEGPVRAFFGSGPGTFGVSWAKYKDPSINQTVFWGVRFTQGQSWVATLLPTMGLIGFASAIVFFGVALVVFLRSLIVRRRDNGRPDALGTSVFLGFVVLLIAAFVYPANMSLMLALFFLIGILSIVAARRSETDDGGGVGIAIDADDTAAVADAGDGYGSTDIATGDDAVMPDELSGGRFFGLPSADEPPPSFWDMRVARIRFATPWSVFASSLGIVFLLAASAAGLYEHAGRAAAASAAHEGVMAANKGDFDGALAAFGRAMTREPRDFHTLQAIAQIRGAKIQQLVASAVSGKDVREEFQSAVSLAIQDVQNLTQMYPDEPEVWRLQGAIYELVIPYIQGSERFAATAYQNAAERDPSNPAIFTDWGRAGLTFTDRILALENQASAKDKEQLEEARKQNLGQVAAIFQRAITLKPDFASAHFLLAQTAIRLGDIDAAIQSEENAKAAAPFDIGVAFQLGLLYYQKQDMDRAQVEMERAVSLNENYSNARYFLGLIYDKKGDKPKALEQFNKVAALNPDNQEIRRILENLTQGKAALDGIVPPAAPPEKRPEPPVKEKEQRK